MTQTNEDNDVDLARIAQVLADAPDVTITMQPMAAITVIGQLQLALRHPENVGPGADLTRLVIIALRRGLPEEAQPLVSAGDSNHGEVCA